MQLGIYIIRRPFHNISLCSFIHLQRVPATAYFIDTPTDRILGCRIPDTDQNGNVTCNNKSPFIQNTSFRMRCDKCIQLGNGIPMHTSRNHRQARTIRHLCRNIRRNGFRYRQAICTCLIDQPDSTLIRIQTDSALFTQSNSIQLRLKLGGNPHIRLNFIQSVSTSIF